MRSIITYSAVFVIFGAILVVGTLYEVPYTVRELVRVDKSRTWTDENFVLMPFENRTSWARTAIENSSIVQVEVDSSDLIILRIVEEDRDEPWFESASIGARTFYWTPPRSNMYKPAFSNPSSTQVNVTAKVTEFFPKTTEYRNVEYYRSLLDRVYGYAGIIAIIVGTTLNVIYASRKAKRLNSNLPDSQLLLMVYQNCFLPNSKSGLRGISPLFMSGS